MKSFFPFLLFFALACSSCHKKGAASGNPASLDDLNRIVATMMTHGGGILPSTNDVAKFLEIAHQTFPNPPIGKKLVLNPATRHFEFVDQ